MAKRKVFSIGSSLADGLEQTIAAAHNYSNQLRIDVVPLHKIEVDPANPRDLIITIQDLKEGFSNDDPNLLQKQFEKESLESLAKSILDQGVINPIVVYEFNNKYRLIAGERRTLASVLAGKTDIQAKILDERPDELKIRILQWIENVERTDLTLAERLDNLDKILQAYAKQQQISADKIRVTDISKLVGCTKPHASNLKAALQAPNDVKSLIKNNKIRNLEKAALLAHIDCNTIRHSAINECLKGATLRKLKEFLEMDKHVNASNTTQTKPYMDNGIIQLGYTHNMHVAKNLFNAIALHCAEPGFSESIKYIDQSDSRALSKAFKVLISHLEEVYG